MFMSGNANNRINEYNLSTAFDVSSASFVQFISISGQEDNPSGVQFSNDGTKMFVIGYSGDDVNEYSLSTAFDISTAAYAGVAERFSVASQDTGPSGLVFNNDGTKMFVAGNIGDHVLEYSLSTA